MSNETRQCNYVTWSQDLIESTLRSGAFPQLSDVEPNWAARKIADAAAEEAYEAEMDRQDQGHPVDVDVDAQLAEDQAYGEAQDEYLASLTVYERNMLKIATEPVEHFRFELKRNGKLKYKAMPNLGLDLTEEDFESIPF